MPKRAIDVFGSLFARPIGEEDASLLGMATGEHLVLFSLGAFVDRHHPARGEPGLARLMSGRAFVQATWRHAVFGWTLGRLA